MKFITGNLNKNFLMAVHKEAISKCENVKAAVAYAGDDPELLKDCLKNNIKLEFWCRYDKDIPVSISILEKFLQRKSPNYVCKLIPNILHSKVIWWVGYGAYIGSANLTDRAWFRNIEAGIYFDYTDLVENRMDLELENFFDDINKWSSPLSEDILEGLRTIKDIRKQLHEYEKRFEKKYLEGMKLDEIVSITNVDTQKRMNTPREKFLKEWNDTLQTLNDIADRISSDDYRPIWIDRDAPKGVQADRFLNAYYYNYVMKGNKSHHNELYDKNNKDPESALVDAMSWWHSLTQATSDEEIAIMKWSKYQKDKLNKNNLPGLSKDDFVGVCERSYAIQDHLSKLGSKKFGLNHSSPKMSREEKVKHFAGWLYEQRSDTGKTILETLYFVLYGGSLNEIPQRIWEAIHSAEWSIPHFGISSLGEIVGWALSDQITPRNGRTSKALKALGYNVDIHV